MLAVLGVLKSTVSLLNLQQSRNIFSARGAELPTKKLGWTRRTGKTPKNGWGAGKKARPALGVVVPGEKVAEKRRGGSSKKARQKARTEGRGRDRLYWGTLAGLHACRFTTVEWMDEMRIEQEGGGFQMNGVWLNTHGVRCQMLLPGMNP